MEISQEIREKINQLDLLVKEINTYFNDNVNELFHITKSFKDTNRQNIMNTFDDLETDISNLQDTEKWI